MAARHLEAKGYEIVIRNWRCSQGEIDLVARAGQVWVFVEVKTRRGQEMGTPEEGVTAAKARKLLALAQAYVAAYELDVDWRIDLVAVELDKKGRFIRCEHLEDVVLGW